MSCSGCVCGGYNTESSNKISDNTLTIASLRSVHRLQIKFVIFKVIVLWFDRSIVDLTGEPIFNKIGFYY